MNDFDSQYLKDYVVGGSVLTPLIVGALIYIIANDKEKASKQIVYQLIPSMLIGSVIGAWVGTKKLEEFKAKNIK